LKDEMSFMKSLEKGNENKHDARLRSKGVMQRKEINHDETFSHVRIL
jgi:hypothetical protein